MSQGASGVIARRRPRAGAAVLLVVGLLTGCGGGAAEPVDTSPTSTQTEPSPTVFPLPSETADPEPQPPEWDPALDEPTLDNAFAFGEYFMELYSYVAATSDVELWLRLSHPECQFCARAADRAQQGITGRVRSEITPISGEQVDPEFFTLSFYLDTWVDGATNSSRSRMLAAVMSSEGHWLMRGVQTDPRDDADA